MSEYNDESDQDSQIIEVGLLIPCPECECFECSDFDGYNVKCDNCGCVFLPFDRGDSE